MAKCHILYKGLAWLPSLFLDRYNEKVVRPVGILNFDTVYHKNENSSFFCSARSKFLCIRKNQREFLNSNNERGSCSPSHYIDKRDVQVTETSKSNSKKK